MVLGTGYNYSRQKKTTRRFRGFISAQINFKENTQFTAQSFSLRISSVNVIKLVKFTGEILHWKIHFWCIVILSFLKLFSLKKTFTYFLQFSKKCKKIKVQRSYVRLRASFLDTHDFVIVRSPNSTKKILIPCQRRLCSPNLVEHKVCVSYVRLKWRILMNLNQINYYFEDILTKCGEGLWPSKSRQ